MFYQDILPLFPPIGIGIACVVLALDKKSIGFPQLP